MFDVRWLMDQVLANELSELLHEYVDREEAATLGGADVESSIYSSRCVSHPLFEHLTSLHIDQWDRKAIEDARVISYVLAHARRLKKLELLMYNLKIDDAFTRQLIGAPLEQLKICHSSEMTDATIDIICQQLAASLRYLTLRGCNRVSRTGFNKAVGENIYVHCI